MSRPLRDYGRPRLPGIEAFKPIERTRFVQISSAIVRCTAEVTQCPYAKTCARRLANLLPGQATRNYSEACDLASDYMRCFMRASDYTGPGTTRIGRAT